MKLIVKGRANLLQPAWPQHAKRLGVCVCFSPLFSRGQLRLQETYSSIKSVATAAAENLKAGTPPREQSPARQPTLFSHAGFYRSVYTKQISASLQKEFSIFFLKNCGIDIL